MDPAGLTRVEDLVRSRDAAARVCLLRDGRVVLDRAFGCRPDSLFLLFSAVSRSSPSWCICSSSGAG